MNVITILIDSLNRDALSIYNPDTRVRTPNIERLAARSTVFENHFVGSLPCMPARREIMSGRKDFLWRPWGPMEVFDPQLPRIMGEAGYRTAVVTDHYHYWEEEANGYIEPFQSIAMVRGHEIDPWRTVDRAASVPAWVAKIGEFRGDGAVRQYHANVRSFETEEDYFPAKVFGGAADWLDRHARQAGPFFLHVESFDVHEPFDAPEPYASMYCDDAALRDRYNIWPPYQNYDGLAGFMAQTSPEELAFLRSQYEAKVTMADRWLGHLLDRIDALDLWDDTAIVLTTDHGHDLGDRGVFGKQYPHWDSHANIPLVVYHPEALGGGRRRPAGLTQTVDLFATILDLAGVGLPEGTRHSRSFADAVRSDGDAGREALIYGTFGQGLCVTDGAYTLFKSPVRDGPLNIYSTALMRTFLVDNPTPEREDELPRQPIAMGRFDESVPYPMYCCPTAVDPRTSEDFLFDRRADPGQNRNLWASEAAERDRMIGLARDLMLGEGAPPEQFVRLGIA